MQPYPWWTLYLEPPFCVRFGTIHLITCFRWCSLFLVKIQFKNNSKIVGAVLVLVAACFYSKFYWKSIQKLIFSAFGTILVLHFFLQKKRKNAKKYKKDTSSKRSHTLGEPYT